MNGSGMKTGFQVVANGIALANIAYTVGCLFAISIGRGPNRIPSWILAILGWVDVGFFVCFLIQPLVSTAFMCHFRRDAIDLLELARPANPSISPEIVPGLPHVTLIELTLVLISYQD